MALMDDESRNLLQQSLRTQQQMVGVLQEMRGAMQTSADLARRMAAQAAQDRQQAAFNSAEPQNGDAHGSASAGSQAGIRQAMATPVGHLGDTDQEGGATQTTPVDTQAGPSRASRRAGGAQAAPQGPAPSSGGQGAGGGGEGGAEPPTASPGGDEGGQTTTPGGGGLNTPDSLLGRIPVIGGALSSAVSASPGGQILSAAKKALNFYSSQRDKNDYYRSIAGGSHYDALGQRFGEEVNTYKNILSMSPGESRAAYKDVTRMGFAGGGPGAGNNYTRSSLLDAISHTKNTMGMSEQESVSDFQVALQGSGTSLKQFVNILEQVSQTAKTAGVNTQMARQMMVSYTQTAQQQGMGAGAPGFAQSVTDANLRMGKRYAQNVDSSASGDLTRQYMAAARSGMSIGQLQGYLAHNDPRGTAAMQQVQTQASLNIFGQNNLDWIRQYKKSHPKAKSDELGQAFADHMRQVNPNMPAQTYASYLSGVAGQKFNHPNDAFEWAAGQATGDLKLKNNKLGTNKTKSVKGMPKNESPLQSMGTDFLGSGAIGLAGVAAVHGKDIVKGAESAIDKVGGWFGLGGGDKKKSSSKEAASKQTKDNAVLQTMFGGSAAQQSKVTVDLSPDAKKLLKAMVVTGGDPYAAAGAASAGRPAPGSSTPTR